MKNYRSKKNFYQIYKKLENYFGDVQTPLNYSTNEELTIAVILSAQCTDARVNIVTPALFQKYPEMQSLANANIKELEKLIYSTGFYRNKAKNIKALAQVLCNKYNCKIPDTFEDLIALPGIGRKTANVIMAVVYRETPGIVVDTHVRRITQLLGLTKEKTPEKIEKDLMTIMPKDLWEKFPLYLVYLGRKFCIARNPKCSECCLEDVCYTTIEKL